MHLGKDAAISEKCNRQFFETKHVLRPTSFCPVYIYRLYSCEWLSRISTTWYKPKATFIYASYFYSSISPSLPGCFNPLATLFALCFFTDLWKQDQSCKSHWHTLVMSYYLSQQNKCSTGKKKTALVKIKKKKKKKKQHTSCDHDIA